MYRWLCALFVLAACSQPAPDAADLGTVEKALQRYTKAAKSGNDKEAAKLVSLLTPIQAALNEGKPARAIAVSKEDAPLLKQFCLITAKPAMFVANVAEDGFENNPQLDAVRAHLHEFQLADGTRLAARLWLPEEAALELIPELLLAARQAQVLVLTGALDPEEHYRLVRLGAMGVIPRDQEPQTLIHAIESVHAGEVWLEHAMSVRLLGEMLRGGWRTSGRPQATLRAGLSG